MKREYFDTAIDPATGELRENLNLVSLQVGDRILSRGQQEFLQNRSARYQDLTDFVWLRFLYGVNLDFGVSMANAVRFLYLGTFYGADGLIQKNAMISHGLHLNKNQQTDFNRQMCASGLIRKEGSAEYIDPQFITKGTIPPNSDSDYIRLFTGFFRTMYDNTRSQTEENHIFYIMQMIPYLNRPTNILSYTQKEQAIDRIVYMPFNDYCKKIGYTTSQFSRLRKHLAAIRVHGELVVGFFDDLSTLSPDGKYVALNPKLCFGGDRTLGSYSTICALFESECKSMAESAESPC